ncbi:MAG: YdcF family protein [Pedobacter sp.]|nr:YdcF family protein [Pedobacter sp.]
MALFVFSNTFFVCSILNGYEAKYPKLETYGVGIVLGGFSDFNPRNKSIAFNASGDRLFQAIKLYKDGVIQKILIASGNANLLDDKVKEAALASAYLRHIGIPDSAIIVENNSRNTIENAKNSASLISKSYVNQKVIVITSAWHIPRARLIFDKTFATKLTYYPSNFLGKTSFDLSDFIIPSAAALSTWPMLFKEWVGLMVDRWRVG